MKGQLADTEELAKLQCGRISHHREWLPALNGVSSSSVKLNGVKLNGVNGSVASKLNGVKLNGVKLLTDPPQIFSTGRCWLTVAKW